MIDLVVAKSNGLDKINGCCIVTLFIVSSCRFDNYSENMEVNGQFVRMNLWDTAGQEDYDRLRPLSYPQTDVFLVCFSVDSQTSFDHVHYKWVPEVSHHCPDSPIILVGTKSDLRQDPSFLAEVEEGNKSLISRIKALELAKEVNATKYMECSAKTQEGLNDVFVKAAEVVAFPELYKPIERKRRFCHFL